MEQGGGWGRVHVDFNIKVLFKSILHIQFKRYHSIVTKILRKCPLINKTHSQYCLQNNYPLVLTHTTPNIQPKNVVIYCYALECVLALNMCLICTDKYCLLSFIFDRSTISNPLRFPFLHGTKQRRQFGESRLQITVYEKGLLKLTQSFFQSYNVFFLLGRRGKEK